MRKDENVKADGVLSVGSIKMFGRINKIIKSLFDSANGNTDTKIDGGEGYQKDVLSIPVTRRVREVPGDFEVDIQDEPRTEGYTNDNSEDVDINNLKNAKQW